jgi:acyl-CoA synthetase
MATLLTLHDPRLARQYHEAGYWRDDTFYALAARHAAERPDAFALRDARHRLTWSQVVAWADGVAAALEKAGLRRGERVSLWLPNRVESVISFLACSRQGYVCNPSLHQNYTVAEVADLVGRIRSAAFVGLPGHGADAARASIFPGLSGLRVAFSVAGETEGGTSYPGPGMVPATPASGDADQPVYLAFTSGTTGLPKGVLHSDNTLLANGRALVADWGHGPDDILLSLSPMSHHIGSVAFAQMLAAGMELVVHDTSLGRAGLDWILESGATYVMGVPTHAMDIQSEMRRRGLQTLGRVRTFYMAGSPIPREVARTFLAHGVTPQNVYGMTENSSHQSTRPDDDTETIVSTCGRACAGFEVAIWDAENPDRKVQAGMPGEIGSRGACLMLGYFGDQDATERSFNRHGWFLSGDLGRLDERGCLEILGRKKDLIIRGGHNIHPARIEDLAVRNPQVARAAAFGVADARLGEKVCLAVIPTGAETPDPQSLLAHLAASGLSKYDMPEYLAVLPDFPLTASGKVLKRELVEWVRNGRLHPTPVRYKESA